MNPGKDNQSQSNSQGDNSQVNGLQTEELTQLREEVEELRKQHTLLQTQLGDKDALINTLVSAVDIPVCVCVRVIQNKNPKQMMFLEQAMVMIFIV